MKILVVSAYYPPHHVGGYELGCRDVVNELRRRGHAMLVLTSDFRFAENAGPEETGLLRLLQRESPLRPLNKRLECRKFIQVVREFEPDLVYFWSQSELCYWLALLARWQGCRSAFFLSDTSFTSWRVGAWLAGACPNNPIIRAVFGRTFLARGRPIVQNRPCHFASEFLRKVAQKNGIPIDEGNSAVIHWGIEPTRFTASPRLRGLSGRLLYVGQMIPQKGVHTAIAAFGLLANEKEFSEFTLTLAGSGLHPDYEQQLREMPTRLGISNRVHFLGKVPRSELPGIYAEHDVLLFPSEWEEPFAITPLEAMAAGLVVVGTTTGGSGELFRNCETAMTFAAGDAADCARAIRELCADPARAEKIRAQGRNEVTTRHTLTTMVDAIETSLGKIVANR